MFNSYFGTSFELFIELLFLPVYDWLKDLFEFNNNFYFK